HRAAPARLQARQGSSQAISIRRQTDPVRRYLRQGLRSKGAPFRQSREIVRLRRWQARSGGWHDRWRRAADRGVRAGEPGVWRRGFRSVWSGWQGDVLPGNDRLTARFPTIPGITGMVREEFIAENTGLLGDTNIQELSEERFVGTLVYPVSDSNGATLTVRQRE